MTEEEIKKIYPEYTPEKSNSRFKGRKGFRYGKLTVLYRTYSNNKNSKWVCLCDCGNYCCVSSTNLNKGTQSCGCYKKEQISKTHKKYNAYDLSQEYGIGYISNTNNPFYFDKEDYDLIKNYCWYENDQGYALSHETDGSDIRLHRLILHPKDDEIIDHKNQNRLDNRKDNLRIANKQKNGINRPCNANNKLGVKGVNLQSNGKKYTARIMVNGKNIHLGSFNTIEEAKKARQDKEKEIFGEFAYEEI